MLERSLQDKPRRRLSAIASPGVLRDPAFRMVWAVIEAGERHAHAREQFADTVLHPTERTLIIIAMSHAGLIRDHDQRVASGMQAVRSLQSARHEPDLLRIHVVRYRRRCRESGQVETVSSCRRQ